MAPSQRLVRRRSDTSKAAEQDVQAQSAASARGEVELDAELA